MIQCPICGTWMVRVWTHEPGCCWYRDKCPKCEGELILEEAKHD